MQKKPESQNKRTSMDSQLAILPSWKMRNSGRCSISRPSSSAEDQECTIDDGAALHVMGRNSLTREEKTVKKASRLCVGMVEANDEATVFTSMIWIS